MLLAAISNAWTDQLLANGGDLQPLVAEAAARGARHVELRMGSLGAGEVGTGSRGTGYQPGDIGHAGDPQWRPVLPVLAGLAAAHPQLTFNLAVSFKIYGGDSEPAQVDPRGEQLALAIEAAALLGRPPTPLPPDWPLISSWCGPHLRIVDPAHFGGPGGAWGSWEAEEDVPEAAVATVAAVAARVISEHCLRLSIENSGQPFRSMGLLLQRCRRRLPAEQAAELGLCFDPTNPVMSDMPGDALAELAELPPDMLMLAHFKQCAGRSMIPKVADGDVDFRRYLRVLDRAKYCGPLVFENPPHPAALENLSESFDYIRSLQQAGKVGMRAAAL